MGVESYAFGEFEGVRFSHVVEERGPAQRERRAFRQRGQGLHGVRPDVPFFVVLVGLRDAFHFLKFRENDRQDAGVLHVLEGVDGVGADDDFVEFVADAFVGNFVDQQRGVLHDGVVRFRFVLKIQRVFEANGSEDS